MDTLSRDSSSSSSNIVPMAGLAAAVLALILAIVALTKLSTLQKTVAGHQEAIDKVPAIENEVRAAASKADTDMKNLRDGVQSALNQVGTEIGAVKGRLDKLEEAAKKAPAPAAAGAKGGRAPTGVVDANGNYTVAKGDTLAGIARKFGVRMDAVEAENPGLTPNSIRPGQKIKIPKK